MPLELLTRRSFSALIGGAVFSRAADSPRPNILWITCEDIGPHIGAYGDSYADTPNLDKLASQAILYRHAWSNAPVCAPARTTIISGMYPPSTGSEHMRSMTALPPAFKMFPCYLREAGYYTSNNAKEDYNLAHTGTVWDESSNKAHWRKRAKGQPFFSVFNHLITHESQIRTRPHTWIHDPAKVRIPAYHPDTEEVRKDWAQYYDNITTMDRQVGALLKSLNDDGLSDDTIIFFYGDHGSGMPRNKRWPYNCGLQVPLLVHVPDKFRRLAAPGDRPDGSSDRLVSFVDLAPTVLSLAGLEVPRHMQGHAFLGAHQAPEQPFLYGFRGRMDERYDMVRSVRDKRYVYVRNFMPHRIYGEHLAYMFETPTTQVWKRLYDEGKLNAAQRQFWETKPPEELYDLTADHDEVHNLANSPQHEAVLHRLRKAQHQLALEIRDVGFLPEHEIHQRSKGSTPYQMGHDEAKYPCARVIAAAENAASLDPSDTPKLLKSVSDSDSGVRYWAAQGLLMRKNGKAPRALLDDPAPAVRIVAAEAVGRYGSDEDLAKALAVLLEHASAAKHGAYLAILSLNAVSALGKRAASLKPALPALPVKDPNADARADGYVARLVEHLSGTL